MAVYVITHKYPDQPVQMDGFVYLYVGACRLHDRRPAYYFDDCGDSISEKNSHYCELTGLYWMWKNSAEEYVGLAHYRRFFTHHSLSSSAKYFYTEKEMQVLLAEYDILVAEKLYVAAPTVYDNYARYHYAGDIDRLKAVVAEITPDYIPAFETVFARNYYSPCNMFYARKERIDEYCQWLFPILAVCEDRMDISGYNAEQARIYGFLAERLLNVWIVKKGLKAGELPMIQTDCSYKHRVRRKLDKLFKRAVRERGKYDK